MQSVFTTSPEIREVVAEIAARHNYALAGSFANRELVHPEGAKLTITAANHRCLQFCVSIRMEKHAAAPNDDIEVNIVNEIMDDDDPSTTGLTYGTGHDGPFLLYPQSQGMEPPLLESPEEWAALLRRLWLDPEVTDSEYLKLYRE